MYSDNQPPPEPTRHTTKRTGGYRYLLEDHPFLGPTITLLLGGICLYATVFSSLLQDLLVNAGADRSVRDQFYTAASWGIAFVIGVMFISFIFLAINLIDEGMHRARMRPAVCEECGLTEVRKVLRFQRARVEGTDWETITCPRCGHQWYAQR